MNKQKYYRRLFKLFRPEVLREASVNIAGCGAGGSRLATDLGRVGVRELLTDLRGELLEEHNILRHELGYASLGKPKTTELAKHILNYNPEAMISTAECNVVLEPERYEALILEHQVTLIADCTDNQPCHFAINTVATRHGVTVVGGAVYDGGVGGHVYITAPGRACYACIFPYLNLRDDLCEKPATIDYSNPDVDELQSTSSLNLDISTIANIQARVALQALLGSETDIIGLPPEVNLILFANRAHADAFPRPLHATFHAIPRNPACLICSQTKACDENGEAETIIKSLMPQENHISL